MVRISQFWYHVCISCCTTYCQDLAQKALRKCFITCAAQQKHITGGTKLNVQLRIVLRQTANEQPQSLQDC